MKPLHILNYTIYDNIHNILGSDTAKPPILFFSTDGSFRGLHWLPRHNRAKQLCSHYTSMVLELHPLLCLERKHLKTTLGWQGDSDGMTRLGTNRTAVCVCVSSAQALPGPSFPLLLHFLPTWARSSSSPRHRWDQGSQHEALIDTPVPSWIYKSLHLSKLPLKIS